MSTRGVFTREEIYSQPEIWMQVIESIKNNARGLKDFYYLNEYQQVIFTGCGSTYYLSCAVAAVYQEMTGKLARGIPASELWLAPKSNYIRNGRTLLIAISRSGETSETLHACEVFRKQKRGRIVTLVCKAGSPLMEMGDVNLGFPFAMEESVAQTRAFSSLYLGAVSMCELWAKDGGRFDQLAGLPLSGRQILERYALTAASYGKDLDIDRIYFLGSADRYGLACELSLKMKEMSLTHSEAFHFMEFRHGPKAMVNSNALVIGLLSEANEGHEQAVLMDCQDLGGNCLSIGEANADVTFDSGIEEVLRGILYLPFGQLLAYERSLAKGCNPDRPTNLDAVVKLTR
jgi:glutamine---fructose-6-phosphate transaminase (isomerizing)